MKGLITRGDGGVFLNVKHFSICEESKTARDGFSPIEVKNPETGAIITKYIKKYRGVEAMVTKIEWYDREYQGKHYRGWKIYLDLGNWGTEGKTTCSLDLNFESTAATRFMKLAENVDFSEPVEFSAWKSDDNKTAFSVKQGGQNVPQRYTRDEPGDCPPPIQKGVAGKWNYDDQEIFLHKQMMEVVIPRVAALNPESTTSASQGEAAEDGGQLGAPPDAELLARVKTALKELSTEDGYKDRTKIEILEEFFGTSKFSDIENMPAETVLLVLKKINDIVVPF